MTPARSLVPFVLALTLLGPAAVLAQDEADTAPEDEDESLPPVDSDVRSFKSGGPFGLGFSVGTINGLSLKLWPTRLVAITAEVGVPIGVLNSLAIGIGGRFHFAPIRVPDSPVAFHVGVGPRFRMRMAFDGGGAFVELGGGAVIGASVTVRDVPVEIFFDIAPTVAGSVVPADILSKGFDVDGLVGLRFFL